MNRQSPDFKSELFKRIKERGETMPDLVFINPKGKDMEPYTTSELLADCTGINHRRVRDAIRKYKSDLESFGKVGAYQTTLKSGQHVPGYKLNEP